MSKRAYVVVGVFLLFLASAAYAGGKFGCSGDIVAVEVERGHTAITVVHWKWAFACFKG